MKKIKNTIYAGSVILALLTCSITGRVLAQDTGAIAGTVTDTNGNPLEGIRVYLAGGHGGTTTDVDGAYIIQDLSVGYYLVGTANNMGYINECYDNVYSREEATLIKVNANQTVSGIDFILEKGGSIAGHVFASDGMSPIIGAYIGIQNYDTGVDFTSGEDIKYYPDGSYVIATGLPSGRYILGAGYHGLVGEFYDNTLNRDLATLVVVNSPDTTFGIDFILEEGGAIAGHVYEADTLTPIEGITVGAYPPTGAFAMQEDETKADGSYKLVGLPTGKHNLGVFVDPTEFHWVDITDIWVNSPDTTFGVDIYLIRVSKQLISNEFIDIAVTDKMPPSNLTIGNTGGLPETPTDDNKDLLFWPSATLHFLYYHMDRWWTW